MKQHNPFSASLVYFGMTTQISEIDSWNHMNGAWNQNYCMERIIFLFFWIRVNRSFEGWSLQEKNLHLHRFFLFLQRLNGGPLKSSGRWFVATSPSLRKHLSICLMAEIQQRLEGGQSSSRGRGEPRGDGVGGGKASSCEVRWGKKPKWNEMMRKSWPEGGSSYRKRNKVEWF